MEKLTGRKIVDGCWLTVDRKKLTADRKENSDGCWLTVDRKKLTADREEIVTVVG